MLGLIDQPLRNDEIRIVNRAHTFFKLVQSDWIYKTRTNFKYLTITDENEYNLKTGGECSVFEILEQLKEALKGESYCEQVYLGIKPDCLTRKQSVAEAD